MPTDPNHGIDEQLQAYAQERRRQARDPFTLPLDQRQRLRDEVGRHYRSQSQPAAPRSLGWRLCWPYAALGASAVATLAVCVVIWREDSRALRSKQELARLEAKVAELSKQQSTSAKGGPAGPREAETAQAVPPPSAVPAAAPLPPVAPERGALRAVRPARSDDTTTAPVQIAATAGARPARTLTRETPTPSAPPAGAVTGGERLPTDAVESLAAAPAEVALAAPRKKAEPTAGTEAAASEPEPVRLFQSPAPKSSATLALRAPSPAPAPVAPAAGAPTAVPAAPAPVLEEALPASPASYGTRLASAAAAASRAQSERIGRETTAKLPASSPVEPASRASELSPDSARRFSFGNQATLSQRFVQLDAARRWRNLNSPPRPQILQDFQLEPLGERMRITDADGSVYEGPIHGSPATQGRVARGVLPAAPPPAAAQDKEAGRSGVDGAQASRAPPPVQEGSTPAATLEQSAAATQEAPLSFTATGMNRSSRQRVVFSGRLVLTNTQAIAPAGQQTTPDSAANALRLMLNNSVVEGQAIIGRRTQVQVRAAPVTP